VLTRQKIANEQQNAAENILFDSCIHPPRPPRDILPLAFSPVTNSTPLKQPPNCLNCLSRYFTTDPPLWSTSGLIAPMCGCLQPPQLRSHRPSRPVPGPSVRICRPTDDRPFEYKFICVPGIASGMNRPREKDACGYVALFQSNYSILTDQTIPWFFLDRVGLDLLSE
jgi:hypothetical protein